jgi:hypothetical protein
LVTATAHLPAFLHQSSGLVYCNRSVDYITAKVKLSGYSNITVQLSGLLQQLSFLGTSTNSVARVAATFQLWVAVIVQLPGILLQFGFLCCYKSAFGWVTATAQLTGVLQHFNFRVSVVGLLYIYAQLNGSLQTVQLLKGTVQRILRGVNTKLK